MNSASSRFGMIYLIFFFSGAVGLAYEIVWARQFSLVFGVGIYAVSAVLVAFLGGLGIGAELFGRMLDRGVAPARLYAAIEAALGIYVLLFPLWLALLEKTYLFMHPGTEGASAYVIAIRLILAIAVLIVPTSLMGGTLPALSRYMAIHKKEVGSATGWLYAINTLGAMTGCILAGFYLIEHFGLTNTLRIGALVNIALGLLVWLAAREASWRTVTSIAQRETHGAESGKRDRLLFLLFGVSGFCALGLEVLWTRMFILLLNNSTYAFAVILAMFLLGIGSGSAIFSRLARHPRLEGVAPFALCQMGIGLFAMLSLAALAVNRSLVGFMHAIVGGDGVLAWMVPGSETMSAAVAFLLLAVFPATFLMGAGFPIVVKAVSSRREQVGGEVGRLYALNTLGCVLGSVAVGYFVIPLLGIQKSLLTISWIAVLAGIYLLIARVPRYRSPAIAFAVLILLPMTALFVYGGDIAYSLSVQKLDVGNRVEYYEEGPSATVLVAAQDSDMTIGRRPVKRLWINGDPIAGSFREALQLERLQAHIPLLLHAHPETALVICFGTGSTAGAAAAHGLENVTVVDISPEVFRAGPMFADGNLNVMENERVTSVEEDGRNFLLTTPRKFDFITSEPPPPSNAGIVSLYTREYYELCRKALKPGGIVTQWIPLHHLSDSDFRMLVASFADVFPHTTMWYTKWDAIMIGAAAEVPIDFAALEARMKHPPVAKSLAELGITNPYQLAANFMMDKAGVAAYVQSVEPLNDDRPVVEFTAPRAVAEGVGIKAQNLAGILAHRASPRAAFASGGDEERFGRYFASQTVFFEGQVHHSNGNHAEAAARYRRALDMNDDNPDARYALITLNLTALNAAVAGGRADLGTEMLNDTRKLDRYGWFTTQLGYFKGIFFAMRGRNRDAVRELEEVVRRDKDYFLAVVTLAGLYGTRLDQPEKAAELYRRALDLGPSETERTAIMAALKKL